MILLRPLGDHSWLAGFEDEDIAARWAAAVQRARLAGVEDVVLAYRSVGVHADPERADLVTLEQTLASIQPGPFEAVAGRRHTIPVLYDGPDLADVARQLDLTIAELIEQHAATSYRVFAVGFLPGFPYAGYLPPSLCGLDRRGTPRTRVPEGSVAIAGRQTAIYPQESPGGWHLLGRTPLRIVDRKSSQFPIRAGDFLKFEPIDRATFEARHGEMLTS